MSAEIVYGRRPVRELLRGRRQALEVLATERALSAEPWVREAGVRVTVKPERDLTALAGVRDHQGVVARAEPYRYADAYELAAGESPLIVCLDRVTDPRNLGAVCRSAEFAGASGVIVPERRSAAVTASTCKASAGAVEHLQVAHVRNLADWLAEAKAAGFWIWGADADAQAAPWSVDLKGPTVLVLGGEGKGIRPRVAAACDGLIALPRGGEVESLNVSAAAAAVLFEAVRQRGRA